MKYEYPDMETSGAGAAVPLEPGRAFRIAAVLMTLTALGYLGNYLKYTLFFNVDFLFGSIFTMLSVRLFGVALGGLSAVVAGSYTYFLWNHPYATVILAAEAVFVGVLLNRGHRNILLADVFYWLFAGMPLVWILYHHAMGVETQGAALVAMKQAVNGLFNAFAANFIIHGGGAFARVSKWLGMPGAKPAISLRHMIFNIASAFVLIPSLLFVVVSSRNDLNDMDRDIKDSLNAVGASAGDFLSDWLLKHRQAVRTLALMAGDPNKPMPADANYKIKLVKDSFPAFMRMGIMNKKAVVVAYYPETDESGASNIGRDFSDRPFYKQMRETLRPVVSDVFVSRVGKAEPVILITVPTIIDGEFSGYAVGAVDMRSLGEMAMDMAKRWGLEATLVDKNNLVIASTHKDIMPMEEFKRFQTGLAEDLGEGIRLWSAEAPKNIPIMQRWKKSIYVKDMDIGGTAGWRLALESPTAPYQKKLHAKNLRNLFAILLLVTVSIVLSAALSKRIVVPIRNLMSSTTNLPARLSDGQPVEWPESPVAEVASLVDNFKETAGQLTKKFAEIKEARDTLEQKVEDRTSDLLKTTETLISEVNERRKAEEALRGLLMEKETLIREIHHRVKNNLMVVTSLLKLQSRDAADEQSRGMFIESLNRVKSMSMIHERLYRSPDFKSASVAEYIRALSSQLFDSYRANSSKVRFMMDVPEISIDIDTLIPLGLIVNELISNSLKHGFSAGKSGELFIELKKTGTEDYLLTVRDNGSGMPKDLDINKTATLGMQLITSLTTQLRGNITLNRDGGTEFVISFSEKKFT